MKHLKTFEKFSLYQTLFGKDTSDDTGVEDNEDSDITLGSKGEHVVELQKDLEALGFKLWIHGVDGKFGYETLGQTKSLFSFLNTHSEFRSYVEDSSLLKITNNTVTKEQQDLISDLSEEDDLRDEISAYFKSIENQIGSMDLVGKKEITQNVEDPQAFIAKLYEICKRLQINPNWLLIVMWKESKINPKAINKNGGASGLIQFMPKTAKGLGTSIDKIREMTAVEQLEYVYKYFKPYVGKIKSAQDLYLATFFPVAMGKEDDFILQSKDLSAEDVADNNKVIDLNKDHQITKSEFNDYVTKGLPKDWKEVANQKSIT
jgi:hypothetical protein